MSWQILERMGKSKIPDRLGCDLLQRGVIGVLTGLTRTLS